MSIGLIFWFLMLLWIISVVTRRFGGTNYTWAEPAGDLLALILFFLLGWRVFGFIIQGALPFPSYAYIPLYAA